MSKKIVIAGGIFTFGSSAFIGFLLSQKKSPKGSNIAMPSAIDRMSTYDMIAKSYDSMVGWDETVMGMWLLRKWLVEPNAKGDILEVATGTGRNLSLYSKDTCTSLTLTDSSKAMLEQAVAVTKLKECSIPIAVALKTTAENLAEAVQGKEFDTVVDTFGLCSFEDPVGALKQMQTCCKSDGKILLLEHGRSCSWDMLNTVLDDNADYHASKWGCVWNRDVLKLINESGLVVESVHYYHFGTTYLIVASPNKPLASSHSLLPASSLSSSSSSSSSSSPSSSLSSSSPSEHTTELQSISTNHSKTKTSSLIKVYSENWERAVATLLLHMTPLTQCECGQCQSQKCK